MPCTHHSFPSPMLMHRQRGCHGPCMPVSSCSTGRDCTAHTPVAPLILDLVQVGVADAALQVAKQGSAHSRVG